MVRFFALIVLCAGCSRTELPLGATPLDPTTFELPVLANAGPDREILRGYTAQLNGSGTYHPFRRPYSVRWVQISGTPVFLSNEASLTPTFVAPIAPQNLIFKLSATDEHWTTEDQVTFVISNKPTRLGPSVRAGPDRFLAYGESGAPTATDLVDAGGSDVVVNWQPIVAIANQSNLPAISAEIFCIDGTRDNLAGAPDHLILFHHVAGTRGLQAPVATVTNPQEVSPGETFVVDAHQSRDSNGDILTWRWQILVGDMALPTPLQPQQNLSAPLRQDTITLRVAVSDGLLESTPMDAVTAVRLPNNQTLPELMGSADLLRRPGSLVAFEVQPTAVSAAGTLDYTWTQTRGTPVQLNIPLSGTTASFTAPDALGEIVFAVIATTDQQIELAPAILSVTIVDTSQNEPPAVTLAASINEPAPLQSVVVSATIVDPEGDLFEPFVWSTTPASSVNTYPDAGQALSVAQQVLVTAADAGQTVTIYLTVCDVGSACTTADLPLTSSF